jgi:uncharacterized membrane protein
MRVVDQSPGAGIVWIKQAFLLFKAQPMAWIGLTSSWILLTLALYSVIPVIGAPIATMLQPALFAGMMLAAREQEAGRPINLSFLFAALRLNGRALISFGAIVLLANTAVVLLMSLFDFPGEIATNANGTLDPQAFGAMLANNLGAFSLALCLIMIINAVVWFATPLLAFNAMPPTHAIRWSFYALVGNFIPMLVFAVLLFAALLLAALPWALGLLVWLPVYAISNYTSYRLVFSDEPAVFASALPPRPPPSDDA